MHKKKWLALVLVLLLVLSACSQKSTDKAKEEPAKEEVSKEKPAEEKPAEEKKLKDGSYKASSIGHQGPVEVAVEIKEGKIASVEITKSYESKGVEKVLNVVPQRIVEAQSYNVDVVSGATFAGNAVKNGVKDCILQAGGSEEDYKEQVAFPTKYEGPYEADVIVIGGGGAGLSAALSAHQNGASVIVLEKLGFLGGSTIFSGGAFNAADEERTKILEMSATNEETVKKNIDREPKDDYEKKLQDKVRADFEAYKANGGSGLFDSPEFHALQTYNGGDYKGTPELIDVMTQNAMAAVNWIIDSGAKVDEKLGTATGALWMRSHYGIKTFRNGTYIIYPIADYIEAKENIDAHLNTQVLELIKEGDRIVGVKATRDGAEHIYKAKKGVVIATGGFGANVEMREKYNEQWDNLGVHIGCSNQRPSAQGEGIVMSEAIGAQLIDMGLIQLHPNGQEGSGMMMGQPHTSGVNRIFVNKEGKRFVAEDSRRDVLVGAIYKQPDGYMWIVADGNRYPEGDDLIGNDVATGKTFKANTVEELAKMIDVPAENLQASIDQYNATVKGEADPFGLAAFDKELGVAPFYAAKRLPTVHHTMGGLKINTKAEVLGKDDAPIKGLYAAGEVTGGIHGANRLGGNAITDIVVFGRIAGESAAKSE